MCINKSNRTICLLFFLSFKKKEFLQKMLTLLDKPSTFVECVSETSNGEINVQHVHTMGMGKCVAYTMCRDGPLLVGGATAWPDACLAAWPGVLGLVKSPTPDMGWSFSDLMDLTEAGGRRYKTRSVSDRENRYRMLEYIMP